MLSTRGSNIYIFLAGRARKGPAPVSSTNMSRSKYSSFLQLNLEVPAYEFSETDDKLVIG